MKVGDFVVERLHAWGVRRVYGYPGDGINGVNALQRAGNIEFIQVRHEEMAAFMAVAHAKFTGELGVCLSTGGPGATHLITRLYDGKLDHAPVLAICGQAEATVRGATARPSAEGGKGGCCVRDGAAVVRAYPRRMVLGLDRLAARANSGYVSGRYRCGSDVRLS
jgi:hypothetical protein